VQTGEGSFKGMGSIDIDKTNITLGVLEV